MFIEIGPEYQCLQREDQKINVYKESASIRVFGTTRSKNQSV